MLTVFDRIISIELSKELHQKAVERFKAATEVKILQGDSAVKLGEALDDAGDESAVVWLDAHYSGEGTSRSQENTPIVGEIEVINQRGNGRELVLIDDIRMFRRLPNGFLTHEAITGYPDLPVVVEMLARCKQGYDSYVVADMLVALPATLRSRYTVSDVVKAATRLRLGGEDEATTRALEGVIAQAKGQERETILALPDIFQQQLLYGLGGDYCYWRGLIHEAEGHVHLANVDFELARRCGVRVAIRPSL
jgi:hypothetical protein